MRKNEKRKTFHGKFTNRMLTAGKEPKKKKIDLKKNVYSKYDDNVIKKDSEKKLTQ